MSDMFAGIYLPHMTKYWMCKRKKKCIFTWGDDENVPEHGCPKKPETIKIQAGIASNIHPHTN
jgi:hypothetical protein